ncbi:MAG: Rdx family protein [Candidatus Binataceae bacterium]|nr:Rdx family protein [Candidatus Binataceae bacterium]
MKQRFGEEAKLTKGSSGQFDVLYDGRAVFSKRESGRFPIEGEVGERIAALREGRELPPEDRESPGKGLLGRLADKFRN